MTSNVLRMVDAFKMDDLGAVQAQKSQQALQSAQAGEAMLKMQNQNVLRELSRDQSDLGAIGDQYQQRTGDLIGAEALRGTKRKNELAEIDAHIKSLELISKSSKMVSADNYESWRQSMVGMGLAGPNDLPATYDQDVIDRLSGAATSELKKFTINQPDGTAVDVFHRGGKEVERSQPYPRFKPTEPSDYETWGDPYEQGGIRYQKSSRGKIRPVDGMQRDTEADTRYQMAVEDFISGGATEKQATDVAKKMRAGTIKWGTDVYGSPILKNMDGTEFQVPWKSGSQTTTTEENGPTGKKYMADVRAMAIARKYKNGEITREQARELIEKL